MAVDLEEAVWTVLEAEGGRAGVWMERLLGHATLCLAADLDSGA